MLLIWKVIFPRFLKSFLQKAETILQNVEEKNQVEAESACIDK